MRRVIINGEVKFALDMLKEDYERVELINALIDIAEDRAIEKDQLFDKVKVALDYIFEKAKCNPKYVLFIDYGEGDPVGEK